MGKSCFSTITKFFAIALLAAATAITAIALLSSPAAAQGGSGNLDALKSWDTDNLSRWVSFSFGRAGARNYRIPYHNYRASGYKETVEAKACVAYNIYDSNGNFQVVHLLPQNTTSGQCPAGYSLVTKVCAYSRYNPYGGYNSASGVYVPFVPAPASYRLPNASGTCERISYRPALYCHTSGSGRVFCSRGTRRYLRGSLTSVPSVSLCQSRYGRFSLRRSSQTCSAAYTVNQAKHFGCQSAVADAFFQTGGDTGAVNDFPVASYGSESEAGTVAGTGRRDRGCVEFAEQQDRLRASVAATGHYLEADSEGELILKSNTGTDILDSRITAVRSAGVHGRWDQKGTGYAFTRSRGTSAYAGTGNVYYVAPADRYRNRVDTRSRLAVGQGLSSGLVHPWNTATGLGSMNRTLACSGGAICVKVTPTAGTYYFWLEGSPAEILSSVPLFRTSNNSSGVGGVRGALPAVHLSVAQDSGGGWCPANWHPRGQDAAYAIGRGTGRTLSSISSETQLKLADAHWCRSDVRYRLQFTAQQHNTCGNNRRTACAGPPGVALPAVGSKFASYGRKNCYKTMTGYNEGTAECEYVFPLPECDPDPDNNSREDWREFTAAEVDNIGVAGEPLLVKEGAYCGTNINPPDLAGFDADPCVAVDVAVFENRASGSNAEPGVDAGDRTASVSSSVAVYDLDISAPFPDTASPPNQNDPDIGPINPSGCADGEEERTSHGTRATRRCQRLPTSAKTQRL